MTKGKGPKDWRPGWITASTSYEVGDPVEVKLYKFTPSGQTLSKWFKGEVVGFGESLVDVAFERSGKRETWPFPLRDVRPTGRKKKR